MDVPSYLKDYTELYKKNPREANLKWFENANYGLFIHYGLYSILGKHEWVQYRERIRPKEYEKLKDKFTAEGFDAKAIVSLAKEAGMKYINITTRHHESFCLWESKYWDFNSMNSPAKRDLIQELYDECERGEIALFLYYAHDVDWKHPHAPSRKYHRPGRPRYFPREKSYARGKEHDLNIYLEFMNNQITELLQKFPNVAGIWLDLVSMPYHAGPELFKVQELYDLIHKTSPHALVSYKHGLLGTEDFFSTEIKIPTAKSSKFAQGKILEYPEKKIEVCTIMTIKPSSWGYLEGAEHRSLKNVVELYNDTIAKGANLLLNTGPLPDGSLDPIDVDILTQAGEIIKNS